MYLQTCSSRIDAHTKRKPVPAKVLERVQDLVGEPEQHAPTQII